MQQNVSYTATEEAFAAITAESAIMLAGSAVTTDGAQLLREGAVVRVGTGRSHAVEEGRSACCT